MDVIAVEEDAVEFPGNDQRMPHTLVSFKETDLANAAVEGNNEVKSSLIKNGQEVLSGTNAHN